MANHKKIFVNGIGWSGSSAFVDLLNNTQSDRYVVIPDEFDDFRVPGTMRDALVKGDLPISHRRYTLKMQLKFLLRAIFPDRIWPKFLPGQKTTRKAAIKLLGNQLFEASALRKFGKKVINEPEFHKRKVILREWLTELCAYYSRRLSSDGSIFVEQFFVFDDMYKYYDWVDFDHLIIFIRAPSYQLRATQESEILYHDYPWQADFLLGAYSQKRKYEVFLDTTINRYKWILKFVGNFDANKVIFVEFEGFLQNFQKVLDDICEIIDVELSDNSKKFDIEASIKRNLKWDDTSYGLEAQLKSADQCYQEFVECIKSQYTYLK